MPRVPARGAGSLGGNAIVAMRFDSGAIGPWSEICAYGTSVWVNPVTDYDRPGYEAMVRAGQLPQQQAYATRVSEWDRTGAGGPQPAPPAR